MSRAARPKRPAFLATFEDAWANLRWAKMSGRRSANGAFIGHNRHGSARAQAWLIDNEQQHIVVFSETQMVQAPAKTCPSLSRLFDEAEPTLLAAFFGSKIFERLSWLESYRFDPEDPDGPSSANEMLCKEKKERLGPLESEAARIVNSASDRGEYVLDGLARTKLEPKRAKDLLNQRDKLARSL